MAWSHSSTVKAKLFIFRGNACDFISQIIRENLLLLFVEPSEWVGSTRRQIAFGRTPKNSTAYRFNFIAVWISLPSQWAATRKVRLYGEATIIKQNFIWQLVENAWLRYGLEWSEMNVLDLNEIIRLETKSSRILPLNYATKYDLT